MTQNTKEINVIQVIPTIQPKTVNNISEVPKLTQTTKNNINKITHKIRCIYVLILLFLYDGKFSKYLHILSNIKSS